MKLSCLFMPLFQVNQAAEGRAWAQVVLNLLKSCLTLVT